MSLNCLDCKKDLFPLMNVINSPLYCGDITHPVYNVITKKWRKNGCDLPEDYIPVVNEENERKKAEKLKEKKEADFIKDFLELFK